ncbi:MAG: tail fiber domain-containing protein [Candidatus Marinimicrobia bacterium]|nr:tail fiber domain-containing protein [Candidatus Neomarinimicrobiota bacterium]
MNTFRKNIIFFTALGVLVILTIWTNSIVSAWVSPTATPPASNASSPLNISGSAQTKSGSLRSSADMRAPIFYDQDNTSYYANPAGNSWLYRLYSYDVRADIFYDRNNTSYYVNPAGTSNFNTIRLGGVSHSSWPSGADNLGNHSATQDLDMNNHAIREVSVLRLNNGFELQQGGSNYARLGSWIDVGGVGIYSSTVNGAHWYPNTSSNYGSWQISGTRGGYSGINYANYVTLMMHSSYMGAYNDRDNEWLYYGTRNGPFYAMYNGATRLTTQSYGVSINGDIRATLFYDTNNTAYYVDPASTSRMSTVAAGRVYGYSDIRSPIFYDYNNTSYYANPASTSRFNALTVNGITLGGSYRSSWPSSGITSESDTLQSVTNRGKTTSQWIQSNSSMRAPIFYDSNNTSYYLNPHGSSRLNAVFTHAMYDLGNSSYYVNPAGASMMSDVRADIFYDRNNTYYRLDPHQLSRLNHLITIGAITAIGIVSGPKFIDVNNSSYYVDPASTSRLNYIITNTIYNYGHFTTGSYSISSDIRLKKDITKLDNSLEKILQLEGVSFKWKDSEIQGDKTNLGLIAQDVEKVYPELVITDEETGLKSVQYGNLIAPLIEAVKEQQKQIEELKLEIKLLKEDK